MINLQLDGFLLDEGGPTLFLRVVEPARPRACLVLVHGSMVHSEYYLPIALRLAQRGLCVVLPDLRGHGRSDGLRGHLSDYRRHVEDVQRVAAWARRRWLLPLFLGGESYGGLVAFLAGDAPLEGAEGLVLAAPAFGLAAHLPPRLVAATRRVAQVAPALRLPVQMRLVGVSHREDLNRISLRDPLLCRQYTVGFFVELLKAQAAARDVAARRRLPALALLAGQDLVTDNATTQAVLEAGRAPTRTVTYPEFLHAVLAEDPERVVGEIASWLEAVATGAWAEGPGRGTQSP
jgi:alpha-beta hydrolase superfamily lysophospholipase